MKSSDGSRRLQRRRLFTPSPASPVCRNSIYGVVQNPADLSGNQRCPAGSAGAICGAGGSLRRHFPSAQKTCGALPDIPFRQLPFSQSEHRVNLASLLCQEIQFNVIAVSAK